MLQNYQFGAHFLTYFVEMCGICWSLSLRDSAISQKCACQQGCKNNFLDKYQFERSKRFKHVYNKKEHVQNEKFEMNSKKCVL